MINLEFFLRFFVNRAQVIMQAFALFLGFFNQLFSARGWLLVILNSPSL